MASAGYEIIPPTALSFWMRKLKANERNIGYNPLAISKDVRPSLNLRAEFRPLRSQRRKVIGHR